MTQNPPFRKIFDGVATHEKMLELRDRVPNASAQDIASGKAYTNQYFEIEQASYDTMFEMLPPLFMRPGMFAFAEFKADFVGSVFFDIMMADGRIHWFTGYCDLRDRNSPEAMRAAIVEHEKINDVQSRPAAKADSVEAIGD